MYLTATVFEQTHLIFKPRLLILMLQKASYILHYKLMCVCVYNIYLKLVLLNLYLHLNIIMCVCVCVCMIESFYLCRPLAGTHNHIHPHNYH